ncbi:Lrp/AsnC family transcriptional regulator [Pedobacter nutrimenti]|jgi:DNA-binding Lrp family transcriptional regulator|uniref:Uncharacterized protein n=1 Tax=Pedobacter nutrimenti TaxID=1241337 RepID=A0A318UIQ2_9SPHI|nr:Lrp/AsnC family transcriptional regulator [Pedobacter nutrimenti]PYF72984.1 hypothetical protein B0O44_105359 [Pedobacter nutrimenti]|eukprot:gene18592-22246_t
MKESEDTDIVVHEITPAQEQALIEKLSKQLGLSIEEVHFRVKRLIEAGEIRLEYRTMGSEGAVFVQFDRAE